MTSDTDAPEIAHGVHGTDDGIIDGMHSRETLQERAEGLLGRSGWTILKSLLALALFAAVTVFLYHQIQTVTWVDIRSATARISWAQIALAVAATAASYAALAGYDFLALRHLGIRTVPAWLVALTSFISQSFTFNLGFGVLTGGAVRMRLYGSAGLSGEQIVATSLLASAGFWLGLIVMTALALIAAPDVATRVAGLQPGLATASGAAILAAVGAWLVYSWRNEPAGDGSAAAAPATSTSAAAVLIGAGDLVASAAALYVLLPPETPLGFLPFLVVFAAAATFGVISSIPGGLGVFEGTLFLGLAGVEHGALLASLLAFRVIYYLVPMAVAAGLFALFELRAKAAPVTKGAVAFGSIVAPLIPTVAAIMVFLGGFVLLVSGALPAEHDRMALLRHSVPLPFVEASHFIASVAGALLLIIAHGLARRLESAWRAAIALLGLGALFSLAKGFDYEEALVCLFVIALLVASRHRFYRQGGLFSRAPSAAELLAIAIALGISIWIGMLTYRGVSYTDTMWWDFSYRDDAPRFLRASLGVAVTALLVLAYEILHRPSQLVDAVDPQDMTRARGLLDKSPNTEDRLALLGDKRFLFDGQERGFVMYGVQGSSWIAMGDPVVTGDDARVDLVWQFKELVDLHAGIPVFYQVTRNFLPAYLDAGFSLVKLGEEAWVDLKKFTLEGGEGRKLRQAKAKAEKSGMVLQIVPASDVTALLPELKAVSDAWLAERGQREKGFSLGFWSETYLAQFDMAVIRLDGQAVAFANIWRGAGAEQYSVDLMRSHPDAPQGVMDLLFISLMEIAKKDGYQWFNLGMSPLSGLPQHRLAPLWTRLARFVSRTGDRFYNFEGLRAYKNKFHPEWRPKYLAYPGGLRLPQVLVDITSLIAASPQRAEGAGET